MRKGLPTDTWPFLFILSHLPKYQLRCLLHCHWASPKEPIPKAADCYGRYNRDGILGVGVVLPRKGRQGGVPKANLGWQVAPGYQGIVSDAFPNSRWCQA